MQKLLSLFFVFTAILAGDVFVAAQSKILRRPTTVCKSARV
jgi:hypothetical protein